MAWLRKLFRTKPIVEAGDFVPDPSSALSTADLVSIGLGSCSGVGTFVVIGYVAKFVAGPGVILSLVIAAVGSLFAGYCYAEFGLRLRHSSGSVYEYLHVTLGEFVSFLVGWSMLLEYTLGVAACAVVIGHNVDLVSHGRISTSLGHLGPVIGKSYPDLVACGLCLLLAALVATGVRFTLITAKVLVTLSAACWVFIVVSSFWFAKFQSWAEYGFLPHGIHGVLQGASKCFFAFVGFDSITANVQRVIRPQTSIPLAVIIMVSVALVAYVSLAVVLTLSMPFYRINEEASFTVMFSWNKLPIAQLVVFGGLLTCLVCSIICNLLPIPSIMQAMTRDGFLPRIFGRKNCWGISLLPVICSGLVGAVTAMVVGLTELLELLSAGVLVSYTLMSVAVLLLRYSPSAQRLPDSGLPSTPVPTPYIEINVAVDPRDLKTSHPKNFKEAVKEKLRLWMYSLKYHLGMPADFLGPTPDTATTALKVTCVYVGLSVFSAIILVFCERWIVAGHHALVILCPILISTLLILIFMLYRLPQNRSVSFVVVPAVPLFPCISIMGNCYLIMRLNGYSLLRFLIWMAVGIVVYFSFGIRQSKPSHAPNEIVSLLTQENDLVLEQPEELVVNRVTNKRWESTCSLTNDEDWLYRSVSQEGRAGLCSLSSNLMESQDDDVFGISRL